MSEGVDGREGRESVLPIAHSSIHPVAGSPARPCRSLKQINACKRRCVRIQSRVICHAPSLNLTLICNAHLTQNSLKGVSHVRKMHKLRYASRCGKEGSERYLLFGSLSVLLPLSRVLPELQHFYYA